VPHNETVSRLRPSGWLDWTFEVVLILKGLDGVLEIAGGLLLLLVPRETLSGWLVTLTQHELTEDPHDFVASHLLTAGEQFLAGSMVFAALYLLAHGVTKVILVVAVLRDKLWAYPWMIGFLVAFIAYQGWLLLILPTLGLAALTVFDIFMVWLTWREYQKRRAARQPILPSPSAT
jgi:uncharacterized membrane protein